MYIHVHMQCTFCISHFCRLKLWLVNCLPTSAFQVQLISHPMMLTTRKDLLLIEVLSTCSRFLRCQKAPVELSLDNPPPSDREVTLDWTAPPQAPKGARAHWQRVGTPTTVSWSCWLWWVMVANRRENEATGSKEQMMNAVFVILRCPFRGFCEITSLEICHICGALCLPVAQDLLDFQDPQWWLSKIAIWVFP